MPTFSLPSISRPLVISFSIFLSLTFDILNNVLQQSYSANPEGTGSGIVQVGKGVVFLLNVLCFQNFGNFISLLALIILFFLREALVLLHGKDIYFYQDLVVFFRIIFLFSWLIIFYENRRLRLISNIATNFFVLIILISSLFTIAGALTGLSFLKAYENREGFKGVFAAANDTSILYLIGYLYAIVSFAKRRKFLLLIVVAAATFILGIGSRAAIAGLLLIPYAYLVFQLLDEGLFSKYSLELKRNSFFKITFLISSLLSLFTIFNAYSDIFVNGFLAQSARVADESGLLSAVFSFRDLKVLTYFSSIQHPMDLLFGLQVDLTDLQALPFFRDETPGPFMIEIDIFDYLSRLGLVGTSIFVYYIYKAVKDKPKKDSAAINTLLFVLVVFGNFVGHTMLSSTNAIWVAFWLVHYANPDNSSKELV
jgi:hypothetical protein